MRAVADPMTMIGPASMVVGDGLPVVDADRCFTGFCCQDICPVKAIGFLQFVENHCVEMHFGMWYPKGCVDVNDRQFLNIAKEDGCG